MLSGLEPFMLTSGFLLRLIDSYFVVFVTNTDQLRPYPTKMILKPDFSSLCSIIPKAMLPHIPEVAMNVAAWHKASEFTHAHLRHRVLNSILRVQIAPPPFSSLDFFGSFISLSLFLSLCHLSLSLCHYIHFLCI